MSIAPVADIRTHRGAPAIHLDGRPQPCTAYKITETPDTAAMLAAAAAEIPGLARRGIRQCWVPVFVGWSGPGEYDFGDLDRRIQTVLRLYDAHTPAGAEPAMIVVRLQAAIFSPNWYVEQFMRDGQPTNVIEFRNPWGPAETAPWEPNRRFHTRWPDFGSTYAISPGDDFWDTHAVDCLAATVRHVRQQPWADRVFGWLPCAFSTNEWFVYSDAPLSTCDHSGPAQAAFRRYLEANDLPVAEPPVPAPGVAPDGDRLRRDPAAPEIAFSRWLNDRMATLIGSFARTIRANYGPRRQLVGVFYGYIAELSPVHHLATSGHLGLHTVLTDPDIDFICSPCQYRYRPDEGAFTYAQVLGPAAHSAALHNKVAILEDDHPPVGNPGGSAFTTRDAWHDAMFFRRNFAAVLANGQALWWYSLGAGWLRDPDRQDVVARLQQVAEVALTADRSPVAEIAVVVDEQSVAAMRLDPDFQRALILDSYAECYRIGAPVEYHELSSFLEHPALDRFKVVIFLNLGRPVAGIERLRGGGRTLIFQVVAGGPDGDLAGMALQEEPGAEMLSVWIDPARTNLVAEDTRYGWLTGGCPLRPVLSVADPAAEALGWLYSGNVGLARRRHADWTAVFSAAPWLPAAVLRRLATAAGVHIYTDSGDVVYANRSYVAVVAARGGRRRLVLPTARRLTDAISGEVVTLDDKHGCELTMKRHETRLFWRDEPRSTPHG